MTIINILNNDDIFTISDYENILLHFNAHLFDEIKIFMYEKTKNYKKFLEIFLDKESFISEKDKLYKYINKNFNSLLEQSGKLFLEFKNLVSDSFINIGEISEKIMLKIIYAWFYNDYTDKKIINQ